MSLRLTIKPWNRVAINGLVVEALSRGVTIRIPDPSAEVVELGQSPDRPKRAGNYTPWNRGATYTEEHRAKIAEGVRRWAAQASPQERLGGGLEALTDAEVQDYLAIVRNRFSRAEALEMIGRGDLVEAKEAY